jgi:sugar phosphate isomerase/epimerase
MRLGATINSYFDDSDPEAYVAECTKYGYRAAPCPAVGIQDHDKMRKISKAFAAADVLIGEVQAWVSALDPRADVRKKHEEMITESLAVADELNAVCCVTVAGTLDSQNGFASDMPHPENFTEHAFDAVVDWVKRVLKQANPRRTKLGLEMSPWTPLDGPDAYLRIIKAVNHPALAVHLDPANAILTPRMLWSSKDLINYCFDTLGPWIVSCHAKDLTYSPAVLQLRHVNFVEAIPGDGALDYRTFLTRANQISPELPILMEHLPKAEDYAKGATYIRKIARELGMTE